MKPLCLSVVMSAVLGTTQSVLAQRGGFIQQIPKDGSWVSYHLMGPSTVSSGVVTFRSVGTETENGVKCRWIELQMDIETNNRKQKHIFKLLLREKDLQPDAKSPVKVIRGWIKDNDQTAKSYDDSAQGQKEGVTAFFGHKLKDPKKLKKEKVVDYQKGQLKIAEAVVGKLDVKLNDLIQQSITQTFWKHKSVPFGTAAMEFQIEVKQGGKVVANMKMTFNLKDHGTVAKSALPDKK